MVSSTFKVIGYLFAACLMVQAQNPAQKTNPSTISGKVTLKGNGVPGIPVGVRPTSGSARPTHLVTTDQQGNYRIPNVAPGQYQVIPAAPQFLLGGQTPVKTLIVNEGENLENVDFALVRGGVITGKVTDADGRPMIEEPVELFSVGGSEANPLVTMNIFAEPTDDRGVYRIYGLRPGKYRVAAGTTEDRMYYGRGRRSVYGQTFHPSTTEESEATLIEVQEGSEATNVDITLRRTLNVFTVYAKVIDGETGKPIAQAMYGLQKFRENGSSSSSGFAANQQGEIKIESVTPGKYALFLDQSRVDALYAEPVRFEVVDQDVKDLVIKASAGISVSGVVVLEGVDEKRARTHELIVSARIDNKHRQMDGSLPNAIVSPDGSFKVGGLRPGVVEFSVWGRRQGPMVGYDVTQVERDGVAQSTVEIKAGEQIKGLRLLVKARTGHVRGVVKVENGQIQGSQIYVILKKVGENNGFDARPDDRGRFISEPLAAGVYELHVYAYPAQGRSVSTKQQVVVADNQVTDVTVTLDLKAGTGQPRP